jgi:hypothetical protein
MRRPASPARERIMRLDAGKQHRVVAKQFDDRSQALRQRDADIRRRLEHADPVASGGERISDAVAHQTAAADSNLLADFLFLCLFLAITHVCLSTLSELR